MRSQLPIVQYDFKTLPPRAGWIVHCKVPRARAGDFLEKLHVATHENKGACFYYPDIKANKNICRFEWSRPWNGDRFGVRVGLLVTLNEAPIEEIEAYISLSKKIELNEDTVLEIDEGVKLKIKKEINKIIMEASSIKRKKRKGMECHFPRRDA